MPPRSSRSASPSPPATRPSGPVGSRGAQAEAAKLNVDLTITDAKNDAQTTNDQVNTLIVSGIKGLAVASVDPTANKPTVQAATDAGIKMITSNRTLDMAYGGVGGA
ncbi:MAG: substrate-binding domain-containing protein, partial [Micropruina sp.]|nr:substrate-binding domain-containing protein [Micropruina sp.]